MAFRDILVQLDGTPRSEVRLSLAVDLARKHRAHLIGLHVTPLDETAMIALADAAEQVYTLYREESERDLAAAKALFDRVAGGADIAVEWRQAEGYLAPTVVEHTRYADLAIVGQRDPEGKSSSWMSYLDEALLTAGRPMLVVPYTGDYPTLGRRVLVAWDGGQEAARAVNDALPLLAKAEQVTVVSVGRIGRAGIDSADITLHLARHGVKATAAREAECRDLEPQDILLSRAADLEADMIVMGAYGHSRMRELILGGVTRSLLDHMTVPVLFSH